MKNRFWDWSLEKTRAVTTCDLRHSHTIKPFENAVGKGEIARDEQSLLFPQCFLPVWTTCCIFVKFEIVTCKLFQYGRVKNLSSGNGLRQ